MATLKKIDAMHKRFGKLDGNRCGECCNLIVREYGKRYFKCAVYGMSCATSTDWAKRWTACGMFNKEHDPDNRRAWSLKEPDNEPMNGQLEISEV
jgi:hypothetical protein